MKTYRRKRKPEEVNPFATRGELEAAKYKKRIEAKRRRRNFVLGLILLCIAVFAIMLLPLFNISKIEVKGNNLVSTKEIVQTGRIYKGDNIWFFKDGRAEKLIDKLSFVDSVTVDKKFPGKVVVNVKEYTPYGYVTIAKNSHILVARNGMILERAKKVPEGLREIRVAKTAGTKPGQLFLKKGTLAGKSYEVLLTQLKKNGYEDGVKFIQLKSDDIRFKYNNVVVIIGDTSQMGYKFNFLKTFFEERGVDVEGCFDISAPYVGGYYRETYNENEKIITKSQQKKEEEEKLKEEAEAKEDDSEKSDS